jgi:hypothetical protein
MLFSSIFAATALVGAAVAENHIVAVANKTGALVFVPETVTAAQGDTFPLLAQEPLRRSEHLRQAMRAHEQRFLLRLCPYHLRRQGCGLDLHLRS